MIRVGLLGGSSPTALEPLNMSSRRTRPVPSVLFLDREPKPYRWHCPTNLLAQGTCAIDLTGRHRSPAEHNASRLEMLGDSVLE